MVRQKRNSSEPPRWHFDISVTEACCGAPAVFQHVTQRGNERRDVFFTPGDRDVYLGMLRQYSGMLRQYSELHAVEVLGYCLMTNHVHLVLIPGGTQGHSGSLAKLLREVQMRYSQYRHAVECGTGHLWQGRYYSCPLEPERLGEVMRYVELNPVRANLVEDPGRYCWSSAAVHLGAADWRGLLSLRDWRECWTPEEWRMMLNRGYNQAAAIREATYSGRPLGSDEFIGRLERYWKRSLRRGIPGRPRKEAAGVAQAGGVEIR